MESFFIQPTSKTPKILFNVETGIFKISGRSIPENAPEFYHPLIIFLEKYSESCPSKTEIYIDFEYFNTSTSRCLIDFFRKCQILSDVGEVKVFWHFEEDDGGMFEAGEDFSTITNVPFEFILKK